MKSDIELVEEAKKGGVAAFSELVHRHQRALLRLALRMTRDLSAAEDVIQESFLKAYQKLDLFEGRSSFKSWLFQIAINTSRNRLRMRPISDLAVDDVQIGIASGIERGMVQENLKVVVRNEIEKLPERQKMALVLRIFEDLSFKEIADIMSCPYDTAKANYRHGLLRLKERLQEIAGRADLSHFEEPEITSAYIPLKEVEQ